MSRKTLNQREKATKNLHKGFREVYNGKKAVTYMTNKRKPFKDSKTQESV